MITARQVRRRRLRVQQLLGATPGTGKSSPGRPIIEGEAHNLAETRSRCRAGSRRLRRRLVLVGGDPAPAGCWTGRHRRPEPADLAGPRCDAHPPRPGAAPSAGDPGWPFIRRHGHQPSRDRPARSGPGLHRRPRPPDAGEDYPALAARFPAPPANAGLVCAAGFDALTEHAFLNDQVIMARSGIWASDPVLVRNLTGLARVQPEALPVIAQLERGRLAAMEHLANRLHRTGRLRRDLTPAHAVDLLLISTAFAAWDELVTSRNRSPAAATAAITDLAVTAVVRGPEPGSTGAPGTGPSDPGSPLPPSPETPSWNYRAGSEALTAGGKQLRPDIASQNPRSVSRRVSPPGAACGQGEAGA